MTIVTALVVDAHGRALLVRRPEGGMLTGLWSVPEGEMTDAVTLTRALEIARELGVEVDHETPPRALEPVRHQFTHLHATYEPVLLRGEGGGLEAESTWRLPTEFGELAMPVAQQKIGKQAGSLLNGD